MEDLRRWVEYTQKITLPHFKKEPDMEVWFPARTELQKIIEVCRREQKRQIRDIKKQAEHIVKWHRIETEIMLFSDGGMRVSELVRANLKELSKKGLLIRSSKNEANRNVALSDKTIEILKDYIKNYRINSDPYALITGRKGRLTTGIIEQEIKEAGKKAEIYALHPHVLRHYCATNLLEKGLNIRKLQVYL